MKAPLLLISLLVVVPLASAIDLQPIAHQIVGDSRTYVRDVADRRSSVWTENVQKANEMLRSFGFQKEGFALKKGEVLAILLNDRIGEDLIQITRNKTAGQIFADYADSGIEFQLKALEVGKKYTHLTAVVFTAGDIPSRIEVRGMIAGGLSEKK